MQKCVQYICVCVFFSVHVFSFPDPTHGSIYTEHAYVDHVCVDSLFPPPPPPPPAPLPLPPLSLPCRRYSSSYAQHDSYSYVYTHSTSFGSYKFMGLDACPSPGPRRPLNFFGILHKVECYLECRRLWVQILPCKQLVRRCSR